MSSSHRSRICVVSEEGMYIGGRWGWGLFEGENDIDIAFELNTSFGAGNEIPLAEMVYQTDMRMPHLLRERCRTAQYLEGVLAPLVEENRIKLDSGLGDKLFDMYRAPEYENEKGGKYRVIIIAALLMRAGASIKESDWAHVKEILSNIPVTERNASGEDDQGFRGPGKRQFMAAMDNYKPGVPRSFQEPSCYGCGKTKVDTGKALLHCAKCKHARYCDADCQMYHWIWHKTPCARAAEAKWLLTV